MRVSAWMIVASLSLFTANAVAEGAVAVSIDPKSNVIVSVNPHLNNIFPQLATFSIRDLGFMA